MKKIIKPLLFLVILSSVFIATSPEIFAQRKRSTKKATRRIEPRKPIITRTGHPHPPSIDENQLSESQKIRLATFREVWKTIYDNFYDRRFNGVDWLGIKDESERDAVNLKSNEELEEYVNSLLSKLGVSHIAMFSPAYIEELSEMRDSLFGPDGAEERDKRSRGNEAENDNAAKDGGDIFDELNGEFGAGIDVRFQDDKIYALRVEPASAAEGAGIKPGVELIGVNDLTFSDIVSRLKKLPRYESQIKGSISTFIETLFLTGERGSEITIRFIDNKKGNQSAKISLQKQRGEMIQILEYTPPKVLKFEIKTLDEKTGYIHFNLFAINVVEKFCEALSKFEGKENIVVDLRGNPGGIIGVIRSISGMLYANKTTMGTEIGVRGVIPYSVIPRKKPFTGKLAIIVDDTSLSASEIFAASLQDNGRAIIVGGKTGGQALPSTIKMLPNGYVLQFPISKFVSPLGRVIEGSGVVPNVPVRFDPEALANGIDTQIEMAVSSLKKMPAIRAADIDNSNSSQMATGILTTRSNSVQPFQDERALAIIDRHVEAIGGAENIRRIKSLNGLGNVSATSGGDQRLDGTFELYRSDDMRTMEKIEFGVAGVFELRFDGESVHFKNRLGIPEDFDSPDTIGELRLMNDFKELANAREVYVYLKHLGQFERDGKLEERIEVLTKNREGFKLYFDSATGLLMERKGKSISARYNDYRNVGNIKFPFNYMNPFGFRFEFKEIEVNKPFDPKKLEGTKSCLDER